MVLPAFAVCASEPKTPLGWPAEMVDAQRRCDAGDFRACPTVAVAYAERANDARGLARANELASRACQHGVGEGCTIVGDLLLRVDRRELPRAEEAFHTGCERGDPVGCERYGLLKWNGPVAADKVAAETAFAAGCRLGGRHACHRLAMAQLDNPEEHQQGKELLLANCQRVIVESCTVAALMAAPVINNFPSCKTAAWYADRACAAKDAPACAIRDACKLEVKDEAAKARTRLWNACNEKSALSCFYWADAEERLDAEPERVRPAYQTACDGSGDLPPLHAFACIRLAALDLARASTDPEAAQPLSVLRAGCDGRWGEACCALADATAAGKRVPADPTKAAGFRDRACALGVRRCCAGGVSDP